MKTTVELANECSGGRTGISGRWVLSYEDLEAFRAACVKDYFENAELYAARSAALIAIERCKGATGQRVQIDRYVSANQIAEDVCGMIDATMSAQAPEGWKLAPVDPTAMQTRAGQLGVTTTCANAIYRAMLAAAPRPNNEGGDSHV